MDAGRGHDVRATADADVVAAVEQAGMKEGPGLMIGG
jgi:hypothetical protein